MCQTSGVGIPRRGSRRFVDQEFLELLRCRPRTSHSKESNRFHHQIPKGSYQEPEVDGTPGYPPGYRAVKCLEVQSNIIIIIIKQTVGPVWGQDF